MRDTFIVELDLDNISSGVKDINSVVNGLDNAIKDGIDEVSELMLTRIYENLIKYGLGGSEIMSDVYVDALSDGIEIGVANDWAVYVEYGTGYVGENSEHHPKLDGWAYDIHNYGEGGWVYPKKGGGFGWTSGMASRPFMYDTWLYGTRIATQVIRKHIRRHLEAVLR